MDCFHRPLVQTQLDSRMARAKTTKSISRRRSIGRAGLELSGHFGRVHEVGPRLIPCGGKASYDLSSHNEVNRIETNAGPDNTGSIVFQIRLPVLQMNRLASAMGAVYSNFSPEV